MTAGIFILAIFCLALQNISYKLVSRYVKKPEDTLLFSAMIVSIVSILSGLASVEAFSWDRITIFLGVIFGVFFAVCEYSYMRALVIGPMSYTSLFLSCALVIPVIAGVAFWEEKMKAIQVIGIILLLLSFVLGLKTDGEEKRANVKWLFFSILTFFSNGMVSVMQKTQQMLVGDTQNHEFMVVSFVTAMILLWSIWLIQKRRQKGGTLQMAEIKNAIPFIAAAAVASTVGNQLVLQSAARIDAGVMFPVMNGGILILCSLAAVVIFKEKLTKKQWIGMGAGIVAVLLISV